jgi:hypothetical protein
MNGKSQSLIFLVLAGLLAGCSRHPLDSLASSQQFTLYSIDGRDFKEMEKGEPPKTDEQFHGYPVLGKVDITDAGQRRELTAALRDGMNRSDGTMMKCFWPRHAIRFVKDGETQDYVICFQCQQLELRSGSAKVVKAITKEPQAVLDKMLTDAGIKLAPKPLGRE